MKHLLSIAALVIFSTAYGFPLDQNYTIDEKVFDTSELAFITHSGTGPFDSYLSMEVPLEPVADLFKQVLVAGRRQMINRGEAHITVIDPVEYDKVLKKYVGMEEINAIALEMGIQSSSFKIVGLGRGEKQLDAEKLKKDFTYFVIVESEDLIAIRKEVSKRYLARGGNSSLFDARNDFYPHITVGFTARDFHKADGVLKSKIHSFYASIQTMKYKR